MFSTQIDFILDSNCHLYRIHRFHAQIPSSAVLSSINLWYSHQIKRCRWRQKRCHPFLSS